MLSEQGIYVSRFTGNDNKRCGNVSFPCRSISYGVQQMSVWPYIYLNGTGTLQNPYTCEAGIRLSKSVSFFSLKSRAYISCLHGKPWLMNGTKVKDGVRVGVFGLAFVNTPLVLVDASFAANDTIFAETKSASLNILVENLSRFDLSLKNVVFQQNTACMKIYTKKGINVFVTITNTVFYQNGNPSSNTPSVLQFNSDGNFISIEIKNCSFADQNTPRYGMIAVMNVLGTTNVLLSEWKLKGNNHIKPRSNGIFVLFSAQVFIKLEHGFFYKTSATILKVAGQSAQIYISNIEVDEFYSGTSGGVLNLVLQESCYLSIKDSCFRDGKNNGVGGVVATIAPVVTLTIQNSTIRNISSSYSGGTVFIKSRQNAKSLNRNKNFFVILHIINSSFSYSASSKDGGAICISGEKIFATVRHSSFLRNSAAYSGGLLYIDINDVATINIYDVYLLENSVDNGGIIEVTYPNSKLNFAVSNVTFDQNQLRKCHGCGNGIVYLWGQNSTLTNISFEKTHFIRNLAEKGYCIAINTMQTTLSFVTLDTCVFKENVGSSTVLVVGQASLMGKDLIFDSNNVVPCISAVMDLWLNHSMISIVDTTFVNNFCRALSLDLGESTTLRIYNSTFLRNKNARGRGGALIIITNNNQSNDHFNIRIERVLFQENIAAVGSVFYVTNSNVNLTTCTFLNNFARFQGGQIVSGGRGSANVVIWHSVFRQTIKTIFVNNTGEFSVTSFLRLFSSTILYLHNTTFNQSTQSDEPLILVSAAKYITIANNSVSTCPLGQAIEKANYSYLGNNDYSVVTFILSCKECDYNFYSLQRGTTRGLNVDHGFECTPCPRGAYCVPAIKSMKNFWGYQTSSNPPKLAFTICPFGYCKSPPTYSTEYNACQGKRTGTMCGMCAEGYTEALWSTYCTSVRECNSYWYWIVFLLLVFSMAILLVFKPPAVTYVVQQIFWFKRFANKPNTNVQALAEINSSFSADEGTSQARMVLSSTEKLEQNKRQFSRFVEIIFYFYQIAELLLSSSSLSGFFDTQFLEPVLGFFNFQPPSMKRGLVCPFPGLTAQTKLFFKIAPVLGTLIAVLLIYALHSFICRMRGVIRPVIAPYLQASIKTIFLGYVALATASISLIRCVFVSGKSRWFYNGNIQCYQWWQYVSITFNAIFVVPFIFVVAFVSFKLRHDKITLKQFLVGIIIPLPFLVLWPLRFLFSSTEVNVPENGNLRALKTMLFGPYREPSSARDIGALYWQSVLIARRLLLVLIFCVIDEPSTRLLYMTLACVFVLFFHLKVKPFQNSLANNLEALSLLCLVILGLINLFKSVLIGFEQNIKGPVVTVFKIFHWLQVVMLGLFPAFLCLIFSFAILSFAARVLFICFSSIVNSLFSLSLDSTPLLNVDENIDE